MEFEGVSKAFEEKNIIENISFSVEKGEIFGLLGPNGAGKTTLIRLLLDILKPDQGTIRVFGTSLGPAVRDKVGYLPEERGLYRKIKIRDLLVYLAQLKNVPKNLGKERADEFLFSIGLFEHRNKKVEELSKGMQQKVQFLSAFIHNPDLVILDEPFSGLDPVSSKLIRDNILKYKYAGKTIILSTHMMERAQALCDRILMVNRGKRVLYGTVNEIRAEHGKNSLLLEFESEASVFSSSSSSSSSSFPLQRIRELAGVKQLIEHEGNVVELFPEEGVSPQSILAELVGKVKLRRFEQLVPSLDEIFIETVEAEK